jgi:hypothetical protein
MKTVWTILGTLGFLCGAAFLVSWLLAWTGRLPAQPLTISLGGMLLVTGLFCFGEAFSKSGSQAKWRRSDVRVGRLSSFAAGLWFGAGGVAFLGYGWLTEHIVPGILGAFAAGFVLGLAGLRFDRRGADDARAAVRRRGWLPASRPGDGDVPADEVQRRQDARESLRRSIQRHLTGKTTPEQVEAQHGDLAGPAGAAGPRNDWPEVAAEWRAFRSTFAEGDAIWAFNTVSASSGLARGEQGFALVRDGSVVDWFITAVVG